ARPNPGPSLKGREVPSGQIGRGAMKTRICEQFGIEFPIFAFSHCRDVVAAVSRAGGMGVLGALAFAPEQLEIELNWIDEHVDGKHYGVDVVMPPKYAGAGEAAPEHMAEQPYAHNTPAPHHVR